MIQSPRGQIHINAQSSFPSSSIENNINQESDSSILTSPHTQNIYSTNQLVWSNPIRNSLHPQILRQLVFSDNLLIMAQSAKTPLGVNPFWESGATPPIEWKQWFATLKMAIVARDSIDVDKIHRLKPQPTDLFYSTLPI